MNNLLCGIFLQRRRKQKLEQEIGLLAAGGVPKEHQMYINQGHDDQMEIFGYRRSRLRTMVTYLFFALTVGILRLVYHWFPHWYLYSTSKKCKIQEAETILVLELYNEKHKIFHVVRIKELRTEDIKKQLKIDDPAMSTFPVHFEKGLFRDVEKLTMFSCKKVVYIFEENRQEFIKLSGLDDGISLKELKAIQGLSEREQSMRRIIYGPNDIEVKVTPIPKLLFLEVLNPYYIFQILSFALWFADNYYVYAMTIIIMSVVSIVTSVRQTRKTEKKLKETIHSVGNCIVYRNINDAEPEEVTRDTLVPGDVIEISDDSVMLCDAVLLTGNCIVNESMLTGESVPVTKTPVPSNEHLFDTKEHARHTLFCGTAVIQSRNADNQKVLAVVIRTGYSTTKGNLVRSIMYPPPVDFKFEKDSYKFIGVLAAVACVGFIYTVVSKALRGIHIGDLILEACDLITIVVPPALPTAMTIGQLYSQKRLEKKDVFCISPRTINVAGSLNCVCFDKTGTLTEDGLDLDCVVPIEEKQFGEPVQEVDKMAYSDFVFGMVCCHSLRKVKGKIVGDPLDLKMFNSTNWVYDELPNMNMIVFRPPKESNLEDSLEIGIVEEFPFSSSSQRMGVIARRITNDMVEDHFEFYLKGSPEMILNFVREESLPDNFQEVFEDYTQRGYRVIALAHKQLKIPITKMRNIKREDCEQDLNFLGLIVLENRLKPITQSCIKHLNDANIRVIMVTGDNILTALSVAKKCDMITPGQSVITVNLDNANPPNLYYTLNQTNSRLSTDASILSDTITGSLNTEQTIIDTTTFNNVKGWKKPKQQNYNNYRLAMTGKTWSALKEYHPDVLEKIVTRGTIFARMSPENKQQLIQELQGLGYIVAMCGDGANDCGALKAAHTGISLSEAESSVASPFTSTKPDISCTLEVIREGRAGLVTSFGIFKYMAAYSLCQFTSVLILYSLDCNLTDFEFLFIDLGIIATFTYFFGKTESYDKKLVKEAPLSSLISFIPIFSLFCQMILVVIFQSVSVIHLKQMDWYVPFNATAREDKDDNSSLENYTVYSMSSFQYIILAIVFSKGTPYRKEMTSNRGLIIGSLILIAACVYMTVYPCSYIQDVFQLELAPEQLFRWFIVMYAAANFVLSIITENLFIDRLLFKKCYKGDKNRKRYLECEKVLQKDTKWPPLSDYKSDVPTLNNPLHKSVEIIYEKEKFDKNHVLNKLYHPSSSQSSLNKGGTSVGQSLDDLQFSSLPSQRFLSSSTSTSTFKSLGNSQENIEELPLDEGTMVNGINGVFDHKMADSNGTVVESVRMNHL